MKEMFKELWGSLNITKNTTQKLFSLIFALVFWIFVMDTENPETIRVIGRVPVTLLGVEQLVAKELQIVEEGPFTIDLKVKGRRKEVIAFKAGDLKVTVDLFQAQRGSNKYAIKAESLKADIVIASLGTSELTLNFDQLIKAKKPIKIDLVGSAPEPFFVDVPKTSVGLIGVTGPERLVNQVTHLSGQIDVTGVTAAFNTEVGLLPVDAKGKVVEGVSLEMPKVPVSLTVLMERQVSVELTTVGEVGDGLVVKALKLLPNAVRILGEPALLEKINTIKTVPIELSQFSGQTSQTIVLVIPEGIRLKEGESVVLSASIESLDRRIMTIDVNAIELMNQIPGQTVSFVKSELDLMISGPAQLLSMLSVEDVRVTIDLLGLAAGNHQLTFVVSVPDGLAWVRPEGANPQLELSIEESIGGD